MNHLPSSSSNEPRYSSSGQPFYSHVISHIPFESESCAEQDGVYRF